MKKILLLLLVLLTFIPQVFACAYQPEPISTTLGNILFLIGSIITSISILILIISIFSKIKKESIRKKGKTLFKIGITLLLICFTLVIILPLTFPPSCSPPAQAQIAHTLSQNYAGFMRTQEFILGPGEIITSKDFVGIGFDSTQIIFYSGEFELSEKMESGITTTGTTPFSYIKSISKTPTRARAMILCARNGEELLKTLVVFQEGNNELGKNKPDTSLCTNNYAEPCCAVVLVRK